MHITISIGSLPLEMQTAVLSPSSISSYSFIPFKNFDHTYTIVKLIIKGGETDTRIKKHLQDLQNKKDEFTALNNVSLMIKDGGIMISTNAMFADRYFSLIPTSF